MDADDTLSERVADAIRARLAYRRRRGTTPSSGKELAAIIGLSQSGMSARLTGATPIDLNDLEKIAAALGVEIGELLPRPALSDERGNKLRSGHATNRPRSARLLDRHETSRTPDPAHENPAPTPAGIGPRSRPSWTDGGVAA